MADVNDRLIVELQADISKLEAQMAKGAGTFAAGANKIDRQARATAAAVEKAFGGMNLDRAMQKSLGGATSGVLAAGAKSLPVFGGALEELGAAGLVAAAGIAVAVAAMHGAKDAADQVEQLAHAAQTLGIASTTLQEYQFAGSAMGISPEQTRASLESLNAMLGAIQAGEPRAKTFKEELAAIGFTSAQIAGFKTVEDFLPAFADKIKNAGTVAEQARIADRLGLGEMGPLLAEGSAGLARLQAAFRSTGNEIDNSIVAKTQAMNVQMHEAEAEVSGAFTKALLSLEGPFTKVLHWIAGVTNGFSRFIEGLHAMDIAMGGGETPVSRDASDYSAALEAIEKLKAAEAADSPGRGGIHLKSLQSQIAEKQKSADAIYAKLKTDNQAFTDANASVPDAPGAKTLITPKPKRAAADPAEHINEVTSRVGEMLDEADKELAAANASLTQNILEHAALEKAAVDAETKDRADKLTAEKAAVDGDKKLSAATKAKLDAELATASAENAAAGIAKKALIDREAENKIIEERLAHEKEIADYATTILSDAESLADTSAQRRTLALAQLAIEQQQQQADLQNKNRLALQAAGSDPTAIAQAQARAAQSQAGLNAVQSAQTAVTLQNTASPGNAYAANLNKTYGGDLTDQFQDVDVSGINSVGDALDKVIMKTATAKQAFHEWALSVVKDLLTLGTKDLIERPIANLLFPGNTANSGGAQSMSIAATATTLGGSQATSTDAAAASLSGLTVSATSAAMALAQIGGTGVSSTIGGAGASSMMGGMGAGDSGSGLGLLGGVASILRFIPGFAGGTDSAPGGAAWVGENGPELINLPRGSTVTNMDALKAARGINPGGLRLTQSTYAPTFNMAGAVMTEDLLHDVNNRIRQGSQAATAQAVALSRVASRDDMNKRGRQSWAR